MKAGTEGGDALRQMALVAGAVEPIIASRPVGERRELLRAARGGLARGIEPKQQAAGHRQPGIGPWVHRERGNGSQRCCDPPARPPSVAQPLISLKGPFVT